MNGCRARLALRVPVLERRRPIAFLGADFDSKCGSIGSKGKGNCRPVSDGQASALGDSNEAILLKNSLIAAVWFRLTRSGFQIVLQAAGGHHLAVPALWKAEPGV
jgi:hypothetical protein